MRPERNEVAPLKKDLDLFLGWMKYFPNPDKILERRSAGRGIKLYDEIAADPHAYAVLQTRFLAVTGLAWEVQPASEEAADVEIAEFVRQELEACNLREALMNLLSAILKGYSVAEILWRLRDDGRVGIEELRGRGQHRFVFDPDGRLRLLTQQNMVEGEELPERKFIAMSWGATDGNPYGCGLGAKLYWPVWFKKNLTKFWLVFAEKMGSPTVIGKYPPGASPEQQKALLDAITAVQQEAGIKVPDNMTVELLEADRKASGDFYKDAAGHFNGEISKIVLGQTLTTEVGDTGSYAASQTHGEVRQDFLEGDATWVEPGINRLIKWLCDYNFPSRPNGDPRYRMRPEPPADMNQEAQRDRTLFKDLGLPVAKKHLYAKYDVPAPEASDELLEVPAGPSALSPDAAFAEVLEAEKKSPKSAASSRRRRSLTG
jgi:phage gp29-like protein